MVNRSTRIMEWSIDSCKNTRNTDRNGCTFIWLGMNCTEQQQYGPDRHVSKLYVVLNDQSQTIKLLRTPSNHSYAQIIFRSTTRQARPNTERQYISSSISQSSERTKLRISKASTISVGTMLQTEHNRLSQISDGISKPESRLFEQTITNLRMATPSQFSQINRQHFRPTYCEPIHIHDNYTVANIYDSHFYDTHTSGVDAIA